MLLHCDIITTIKLINTFTTSNIYLKIFINKFSTNGDDDRTDFHTVHEADSTFEKETIATS